MDTADPSPDHLPLPLDATRDYLRIQPSTDRLDPETIQTTFRSFHTLTRDDRPWYRRLRTPGPSPIEFLLCTSGDGRVEYFVGHENPHSLEPRIRTLFPDTYEFERRNWHPQHVDFDHPTAIEFTGIPERGRDWLTTLTPFEEFLSDDQPRVPLSRIVETLTDLDVPAIYQVLLVPMADFSSSLDARRIAIEANQDTLSGQFLNVIQGPPDENDPLPLADQERLAELEAKDPRHSFAVTARLVVETTAEPDHGPTTNATAQTEAVVESLTSALSDVGHTCYGVEGRHRRDKDATTVLESLCDRTTRSPLQNRVRSALPFTSTEPRAIVADPTEAPGLCLLDGSAVTTAAARSIASTPGERTALPRPPEPILAHYRGEGLPLGQPLTQDDAATGGPLVLPPDLQPLHVGWFGRTGSGKSTSLISAILANHAATDGADILIDPKGDSMALEYLRAHYATYGHLDDVIYFDCATHLPAFSFFDVRDQLDAGVPRATAVEDTVDHYVEILTQIMGRDRFEQAVRAPDVIRYLVKAMFDPINGDDAFTHRDLHATVRRMHERQSAPSVSDSDLEQALGGLVANRARTFDEIMAGVANRIEKIPVDQRLARIFNHVADGSEGDTPQFDIARYLNEDVVIIFDTGELRSDAQRAFALVVLSNLWTALHRRTRRASETEHPLVNLYVEEAASVAVSNLLSELLAQARGFGCSVTLAMQFPAQLRAADESAYDEVLNNIGTFVTGNVPVDRRLAERLATDDMDARAVGNRLRALRRGQWLVSLPAAFGEPAPRPFLVGSQSPPPGVPDGPAPLSAAERQAFEAAFERMCDETRSTAGLTLAEPNAAEPQSEEDATAGSLKRVDSALPYTKRLPPTVEYDASMHALCCTACDNRYDPSAEGMVRAISCCSSIDAVDRDDVPICALNLKLTPEECLASEWSHTQLCFLQAVYNAHQLRYDSLEYDLVHDSMLRLQEYVGIDSEAVTELLEADLLRHDTDHPHRLFSVTPDGRDAIGEAYRQGVDFGHGKGDLEESAAHVLGVEVGKQYLTREFVDDPDSAAVEVVPYYELDENRRLDVAAVDADGELVAAVEVERINHDVAEAVPADFDKMAACELEAAVWIVMSRTAGHDVLAALTDPPDGDPRVEKTYAETTPPQQFRIDSPGLTDMYPVEYLRDRCFDRS